MKIPSVMLHNNVCIGSNIKMYESRNCIVHTTQEKKVVVQGLTGTSWLKKTILCWYAA